MKPEGKGKKRKKEERKKTEGAPGLVVGGEVLQCGGGRRGGRPASSWMPAARGDGLVGRHGGGDAHGQERHGRAYRERERRRGTGERSDLDEEMGISGLIKNPVLCSSAGFYPSLLLWHAPMGHGRDRLVVARGKNSRYYYQLSSSAGL